MGDVRVRSLPFSLEGDVDEPGHRFVRKVLGDELLEAQMQTGDVSRLRDAQGLEPLAENLGSQRPQLLIQDPG